MKPKGLISIIAGVIIIAFVMVYLIINYHSGVCPTTGICYESVVAMGGFVIGVLFIWLGIEMEIEKEK